VAFANNRLTRGKLPSTLGEMPKLKKPGTARVEMVWARVSVFELNLLEDLQARTGRSRSELLRELIREAHARSTQQ
jgi:hypothetical protein